MKNSIIKYGILGGVSVVAYFLAFYFFDSQWMFHPLVNWGSVLIYLVFMTLAGRQDRIPYEGAYPFKNALRTTFATFALISVIYYVFNYLLFKLDPTLLITQKEVVIHNMEWLSEKAGMKFSEEEIQNLRKEYRPITIMNSLFGLAQSLIGGFILALPVAAIVRR